MIRHGRGVVCERRFFPRPSRLKFRPSLLQFWFHNILGKNSTETHQTADRKDYEMVQSTDLWEFGMQEEKTNPFGMFNRQAGFV